MKFQSVSRLPIGRIAALAAALCGIAAPAAATQRCELPAGAGQPFAAAWPGDVDLDPIDVKRAVDYATQHNSRSVRVYRHNCLVATSALDPLSENVAFDVWSTTKGVTSMLAGRAEKLGYLDLDDPIGPYLEHAYAIDAEHAAITIRQLLTQSSGLQLKWPPELTGYPDDEVQYTIDLPFDHPRGTHFEYGQTTVTLLARVIEEAVGQDLQDFAHEQLFAPIGIERTPTWGRDRAGNTIGHAHLELTPIEMAAIGHMALHDGTWRGQELIRADYIQQAQTPSPTNPYYGYLLWSNRIDHGYTVAFPGAREITGRHFFDSAPPDLYMFVGFRDQLIIIIPSLDMVIVRTGEPGNNQGNTQQMLTADSGEWHHEFFRLLMRGVEDQAIPDPGPYDWDSGEPLVIDIDHFLWVPPLP